MKILALLYPGFTLIDFVGPAQCFGLVPGVTIETVARRAGPVKVDFGTSIVADKSFADIEGAPDVFIVPGGPSGAFNVLKDDETLDFVARVGERAGWIASVCNGSLILGAAGLLRGYRAGCYWYSRNYLSEFGAIPVDDRVVIDRNRATGGGMTAGVDFGISMVGTWFGDEVGRLVELTMEYAPKPPYGCGRPELAPPETLAAANAILVNEMPNDVVVEAARRRLAKAS
ncbi:DJ-1/PfpI family protein [Bradyrhizobium tropiciagri]|uniref:DJ-1/PfpI family protein n=1 Tax=Bradyrhizobium tropiciagri TaxID=312253 RepID=UPI001BA9E209|nr:DJ-1/PfpI family protein [Bradyrhizobium tropiciagri]MBR0896758.1 DJ-1/PfpI family protein [Bradyrhizobium tropiciagri]